MQVTQLVYALLYYMQTFSIASLIKRPNNSNPGEDVGFLSSSELAIASDTYYDCWTEDPRLKPTTVDTCRPTLNKIRKFPDYSKPQYFKPHKSPLVPFPPPFTLQVKNSTCEFRLIFIPKPGQIEDRFSWRDVRDIATNIVEECQPPQGQGLGGRSEIPPNNVWGIQMVGVERFSLSADDAERGGFGGNVVDDGDALWSQIPAYGSSDFPTALMN